MPEIFKKIISEQLFLKSNYEAYASSPIHLGSNREFLAVLLKEPMDEFNMSSTYDEIYSENKKRKMQIQKITVKGMPKQELNVNQFRKKYGKIVRETKPCLSTMLYTYTDHHKDAFVRRHLFQR